MTSEERSLMALAILFALGWVLIGVAALVWAIKL